MSLEIERGILWLCRLGIRIFRYLAGYHKLSYSEDISGWRMPIDSLSTQWYCHIRRITRFWGSRNVILSYLWLLAILKSQFLFLMRFSEYRRADLISNLDVLSGCFPIVMKFECIAKTAFLRAKDYFFV